MVTDHGNPCEVLRLIGLESREQNDRQGEEFGPRDRVGQAVTTLRPLGAARVNYRVCISGPSLTGPGRKPRVLTMFRSLYMKGRCTSWGSSALTTDHASLAVSRTVSVIPARRNRRRDRPEMKHGFASEMRSKSKPRRLELVCRARCKASLRRERRPLRAFQPALEHSRWCKAANGLVGCVLRLLANWSLWLVP